MGGFECYIAADDDDTVAAEVYCDDDAEGNDLLNVTPVSNTLNLVMRVREFKHARVLPPGRAVCLHVACSVLPPGRAWEELFNNASVAVNSISFARLPLRPVWALSNGR